MSRPLVSFADLILIEESRMAWFGVEGTEPTFEGQEKQQYQTQPYDPCQQIQQFQQMNLDPNPKMQFHPPSSPFVFQRDFHINPTPTQISHPPFTQHSPTSSLQSSSFIFQPHSHFAPGFGVQFHNSQPFRHVPPQPMKTNGSEIFLNPGRKSRPSFIVVILRGPTGSGKSRLAKLVRDIEKEAALGARIHCLDDYFVEETGDHYDESLQPRFQEALFDAYLRTIANPNLNPLVLVDAVNESLSDYEQFYQAALSAGYTPFIAPVGEIDPVNKTPDFMNVVDMSCFEDRHHINEVDMEECDIPEPTMQPRPPSPPVKSSKHNAMDRWDAGGSDEEGTMSPNVRHRANSGNRESQGQCKRVRWCDGEEESASAGPGLEDVVDVVEDRPPFEIGAVTVQRRRAQSDPGDLSVHFEQRRKVVVKGGLFPSSGHENSSLISQEKSPYDDSSADSFADRVREDESRYRQALQIKTFDTDEDDDDDCA